MHSVDEAFEWPSFMMDESTSGNSSTLQRVADVLSGLNYVECFAGISGHGIGISELVRDIRRRGIITDYSAP